MYKYQYNSKIGLFLIIRHEIPEKLKMFIIVK